VGLDLEAAAKGIGVPPQRVESWERGEAAVASRVVVDETVTT
jgi:hypothetical protein